MNPLGGLTRMGLNGCMSGVRQATGYHLRALIVGVRVRATAIFRGWEP